MEERRHEYINLMSYQVKSGKVEYLMASMTAVMYSSFVIVGVSRGVVLNSK